MTIPTMAPAFLHTLFAGIAAGIGVIVIGALMSMAVASTAHGQTVEPYDEVNSRDDDYAAALRTTPEGVELWLTTSRDIGDGRSRRTLHAQCGLSGPLRFSAVEEPVNQQRSYEVPVTLDGCPTFAACSDGSYGVIATNRLLDGWDYDNDLYSLEEVDGAWTMSRLDRLSSGSWDDTPALSSNGEWIFFASDRLRPGSGQTDIYLAYRGPGGWTDPTYVESINTMEFSEQTPFVGDDGYLYFSTNRSGDYDIWRAPVEKTGAVGTPEPYVAAGINQIGSDEGHPIITPGGGWFLFSSNRGPGGRKDFDIYRYRLAESPAQTLTVSVNLRTQRADQDDGGMEDVTLPVSTLVTARDVVTGDEFKGRSAADGTCTFTIPQPVSANPAVDFRTRALVLTADPVGRNMISSVDTLLFDISCTRPLDHTLFLWDTATYYAQTCRQTFKIRNVQFFITGYWCPTTRDYTSYTLGRSVFGIDDCRNAELPLPTIPCATGPDEFYTYEVIEPRIEAERRYGLCVDMNELRQRRDEFATHVDSALQVFVENMGSALNIPCVRRAIESGGMVRIEVEGWTDPRPLHEHCQYTGNDIDFNTSFVKLEGLAEKGYIANGVLKSGTAFNESGSQGNQLLSELRAYYTADLLDRIWQQRLPEYRTLRAKAGQLEVVAIGRAISQQDLPYEKRRSVSITIDVPSAEAAPAPGLAMAPGGRYFLCDEACPAEVNVLLGTR